MYLVDGIRLVNPFLLVSIKSSWHYLNKSALEVFAIGMCEYRTLPCHAMAVSVTAPKKDWPESRI